MSSPLVTPSKITWSELAKATASTMTFNKSTAVLFSTYFVCKYTNGSL